MKIARVELDGAVHSARVVPGGYQLRIEGAGEREVAAEEVRLLPPSDPTKILAVGWNFAAHIEEMRGRLPERARETPPAEPLVFLKPPSSLIGSGEAIIYPREAVQVEYEGELVVVIGSVARRLNHRQARGTVAGWTCGNDVTERHLQRTDRQWWRAKGFDTFTAAGPYLETESPVPNALIQTRVNGIVRQEGRIRDMIWDPYQIVAFVSQAMTLYPGDLIMLGTPPGVGELGPGDFVEVEIEGVGVLRNPVAAEPG